MFEILENLRWPRTDCEHGIIFQKGDSAAGLAVVSSEFEVVSLQGERVAIQVLAKPGAKLNNITGMI